MLEVDNICKAMVPKRISDIEAAEYQRRKRRISNAQQNYTLNEVIF